MTPFSADNVSVNVACCVVVVALIFATASDWYYKPALMLYAAVAAPLFFVPSGEQLNVAICVGSIAFAILQYLSMKDNPVVPASARTRVPLFVGRISAREKTFNTISPALPRYKYLPRSINNARGEQFSYTFWIKMGQLLNDKEVIGKTILLRGDPTNYTPLKNGKRAFTDDSDKQGITIACPRISFLSTNQIAVDVNTDRDLRARFVVGSQDVGPYAQKNILSFMRGNFIMLAFVFEDHVGTDNMSKGFKMICYVNGTRYSSSTFPGSIRTNEGLLYVFPKGNLIEGGEMADLTYYNYAISPSEVTAIFDGGFEKKLATTEATRGKAMRGVGLSPYNQTDVYNLDANLRIN